MQQKHLIVLSGPTAVGKTALSLQMAERYNTPIISADSRQIYRGMDIGTAKPSKDILEAIPHHFINHIDLEEVYSAGQYEREALSLLDDLFKTHKVLLLTGGTGLYIDAVCEGFDRLPAISYQIKQSIRQDLQRQGLSALQNELRHKDPDYYQEVDLQNSRRVTRALEVIRQSGRPFSSFRNRKTTPRPFVSHYIRLYRERTILHERINRRVNEMVKSGLIEEARSLYPLRHLQALDTVGYRELFRYFDGDWTLEEAIEKIKTHTRRYAKRQETWFRRSDKWETFPTDATGKIITWIDQKLHDH